MRITIWGIPGCGIAIWGIAIWGIPGCGIAICGIAICGIPGCGIAICGIGGWGIDGWGAICGTLSGVACTNAGCSSAVAATVRAGVDVKDVATRSACLGICGMAGAAAGSTETP